MAKTTDIPGSTAMLTAIFQKVIPVVRSVSGFARTFGMRAIRDITWVLLALILLIPSMAQAAITTVASSVSPGWSNHRNRNVFYNGTRFFLLYGKGDGSLYYQSSTDNVTWSGESTLITELGGLDFDIYLINDAKFNLVYRTSSNANRVRTCTISGATITAGSASTFATAWSNHELAVARGGGGDRIYVVGRFNDYLRIYSADQTGDAQNVTSWTNHLDQDRDALNVAMVPYQGTDEVLVVYTRDAGGSTNDGVYSRVIAAGGGSGTEVECGDFDNLSDISSPVRISDTDFRRSSMMRPRWSSFKPPAPVMPRRPAATFPT